MTKARILANIVSTGSVLADGSVAATGITGAVPIASGGTGASTRQDAINALAGALTAGHYLRGHDNGVAMSGILAEDVPTLNQNTTGSAATLTTPRTISITGDVAYTSGAFDGSTDATGVATLSNSGVTPGTYGSDTNIPQLAVDSKGRVTSVTNVAVSIPSGALTFTGDVTGTGSTGATTDLTLAPTGTAGTYTKVTTDSKGRVTSGTTLAASDIPSLDASKITSGTIDAARLPSYVDDVVEAANLAGFPTTGETGKIYVAIDTNKAYRWSGSTYVYITSGAVDSVAGRTGVVTLTSSDVGLGSVDNTSDAAKPVSTAQQTALNLKANLASPTFTGTVAGITKAMVGLGSVDNTSDAAKSVASAASLTTARTLTIGSTGKTFNGSANVAWTLAEIGAYAVTNPSGYTTNTGTVTSVAGTGGYGGLTLSGTVTTSGSLTLGGTPTGTWPISISGNAATATSADQIDGVGFRNTGSNSGVNADTLDSNGVTYYTAGVSNFSGNASDGALYSQVYSTAWQHQIAGDYRSGQIAVRGKNSGTWQAWRTVLDSVNYNSYAPTLTGTGASGTWGINVTGYSNYVNRVEAYQWNNATLAAGYNSGIETSFVSAAQDFPNYGVVLSVMGRVPADPGGNFQLFMGHGQSYGGLGLRLRSINQANNAWTSWKILLDESNYTSYAMPAGSSATNSVDVRAPIFYDSNNTAYYTDPASSSILNSLRLNSGLQQGADMARPLAQWGATSATGMVFFELPGNTSNYGMIHAVIDIYEYNSNTASTVIVGGHNWNGAWYNVGANVIGQTDKAVRVGVRNGKYVICIGSAGSSWSYGTVILRKIHNGAYYSGIINMGAEFVANITTTESLTSDSGDLRALRTPSSFNAGGIIASNTDVRAPIFYDTNNTGYYVDPNSGSRLNTITTDEIYNYGWFRNYESNEGMYNQATGQHWYSDSASYWNMGGGGVNGQGIRFRDNHNSTVRGYVYYDQSNNIGFLNQDGSWRLRVVGGDYSQADGSSMRAPLYYDSNDTYYYVDPASTSITNRIGAFYLHNNYDVASDHPFGVYFASGLSSAYGIFRESGAWNWPYPDLRIAFHTGIKFGANASYQGMRFYTDYDMSSQVMSINNGSDPLGGGNVYVNSSLQADSSLRSPIYYDSNNTGYYVDPASTTNLNVLFVNGQQVTGGGGSSYATNLKFE